MAVENLHIKRLKVENYKSLKNSEIELKEGLNVIIGRNGAGKSNLLEFMHKHALEFNHNPLRPVPSNYVISFEYFRGLSKQSLSYQLERRKEAVNKGVQQTYVVTLTKSKKRTGKTKNEGSVFYGVQTDDWIFFSGYESLDKELKEYRNTQERIITFTIPQIDKWVSVPGNIIIDKQLVAPLVNDDYSDSKFIEKIQFRVDISILDETIVFENDDNDTIKAKISTLLIGYLDETSINSILERYTVIQKIRFNPNINIYQTEEKVIIENILIEFLIDDNWVPWSYLSDGTKRMFYLISEALSLKEGVLLVEEPELGIHPHQLYKIMDFLKEQSRDKQIIISTHSPLVLDALDENELDRIVIAKYDNGTKFYHLTEEQMAKARKYMNEVGELSYYWLHSDLEE